MLNWVIMRVIKAFRILFTLLLLVAGTVLETLAQQEDLVLVTDRGHYISGELIHFRAFYRAPDESGDETWSSVLYVELVLPNGSSLVQSKVGMDSSGGSGILRIPEGLSSGTYYLKAYTRWMRNCGPEAFVYTSLQIYDPFNEQVLPVDSTGWEPGEIAGIFQQPSRHDPEMLECRLDKVRSGIREEVTADLRWKFSNAPLNMTISVAKAGLHGEQHYIHPGCPVDKHYASAFLPENRGISLSGQAVSIGESAPAPYATIYVTVLGEDRDFFCNYSDSAGRFYFSLPAYAGERELFVSTYHPKYGDLELLIDRDFSQNALHLPSHGILLSDSLVGLVGEMSVNAQIAQQYYPVGRRVPEIPVSDGLQFYGQPTSTIMFDDFIKLPKLEEYFIEVVPQVAVRRSGGVRRLVLLGEHPELAVYPPLLMIDGVAIFDLEAVLGVSPRLIERVEIVNAPYIRGNVTFGGIISLISKNNDLGYIDLPSSGLLVNYRMLDLPFDESIRNGITDPRLPDVRNTLYWNADLELEPGKEQRITFRTADLKGDYEILIRGFDSAGQYLEKRVPFRVD